MDFGHFREKYVFDICFDHFFCFVPGFAREGMGRFASAPPCAPAHQALGLARHCATSRPIGRRVPESRGWNEAVRLVRPLGPAGFPEGPGEKRKKEGGI